MTLSYKILLIKRRLRVHEIVLIVDFVQNLYLALLPELGKLLFFLKKCLMLASGGYFMIFS